ncbi:hypothetical protein AL036_07300 [Salipiger aestuarii]|uniref:Uncharacterized protein DUF421 n=1 Tax=Salipiger aestuarii TaxID=568098 RepID=A0A327YIL8_9RHOB|nr:YetF domain-containing protein [Salipiger aestuarii]EIE51522.1 hypothetical protein C357_08396 [Citreicella sp. 357]KAA8608460.1 hypothetical protein AL036_07300 [Salipiger aestuarii]KAA8612263.1 hypothetical protein AL037_07470 [Salipiger aestuarii]KAB2541389.1 hypothetical protein AL035_12630 [Salipiger aestuarii]RAK20046.1 uncharacterized protein DUF421 [Salipiger aestuarii]
MFLEQEAVDVVLRGVLLSSVALCWVILMVRLVGLRAFSKMTAFDFVVTLAIGSLLAGASQADAWPPFFQTIIAMGALLGVQYTIARLRNGSDRFEAVVQNSPVLLMHDGRIITEALNATRVAEDDLIAKLREANALDFSKVRAVVLETTGDISVLHGDSVQDRLLEGVRRVDNSA